MKTKSKKKHELNDFTMKSLGFTVEDENDKEDDDIIERSTY